MKLEKLKNSLKKFLGLKRYSYERLVLSRKAVETIMEMSKMTAPREFIAFLEGGSDGKILRVEGLAYQEYFANEHSTLARINFPLTSRIVGSVHSHPGASNRPSSADLVFFSKHGMAHLIIKYPYQEQDIQAYDKNGNAIGFEIAN